ncbi:hypothetical protein [Escherichia coli]|uniref:hypothetical protein n=1 Tax=Escherichia coli TaxID=562 RepID=UPI0010B6BAF6|nr:hypothetical protein [Escherichia coli]GCK76551.1 phage baseplate assembly protein [Escherichia coli]
MSLADEVAELRRRVADMVRRGVVEEVIPGSPVMVRVDTGTEIRYDRQANALFITLAEGGSYKITGRGTLDGPVEITDTLTVQGKTKINADTQVLGNIGASQEITDKTGSMSKIREIYNTHDHPGDSGGTTRKPNQEM